MNDNKLVIKSLLLTAASYAGIIIASIIILFGGLYLLSWLAELLATKLPFWLIWGIFFIIVFGLFFGTLASSPAAHQKHK